MSSTASLQNSRFKEIDLLRGIAVIGMIIFHVFFILNYFGIVENQMNSGGFLILGDFVRYTFLFVVGISMSISFERHCERTARASLSNKQQFIFKQWKRAGIIFVFAELVSFFTWIFVGEEFVRFGILHLIAVGIFITAPMADKKILLIITIIITLSVAFIFNTIQTNSILLYILGANIAGLKTIDYFPLFQWLWVICLGILIMQIFQKNLVPKSMPKLPNILSPILYLGRHSLFIYMAHIPLIMLILVALGFIT